MKRNEVTNKMIGRYSFAGLVKDSDKDGVVNMLDCQPNNPHKQGWVHDAIERFKAKRASEEYIRGKVGQGEVTEKNIEEKYVVGSSSYKTARQEIFKQKLEKAKEKAREEAVIKREVSNVRAREMSGGGGFLSQLQSAVGKTYSQVAQPKQSFKRHKSIRYVKKGKTYKRVVSYSKVPVRVVVSKPRTMFGSNISSGLDKVLVGEQSKKSSGVNAFNFKI